MAQALGVKEQAGKTIQKVLVDWLRSRHALLLLDNCEHLVAACASLASDLLRNCPQVHILATSREPLHVAGEQTYRVPSLSSPDPRKTESVETLSQYEAVTLFIERARAVQPSFSVTDANAPAVAQVCYHLDGIPLAIELAAARVRAMPVEQVMARLGQRFRLLTGGSRDVLPRQQTLRALIDWSYDLLNEQEKALLSRLSVFAGGWTLSAAEAVCVGEWVEDWEVLDLLTSLVDKSLAQYEAGDGEGGHYRLLETVRQYAGERLAERGEADAVRDAHLAWCLTLSEEADSYLRGPEQGVWLSRLEAEHDNLRAGLTWGQASTDGAARGLNLAGTLARFWIIRGHWSEARERLTEALARGGADGRTRERGKALSGLGSVVRSLGDVHTARRLTEEALEIDRENGDQTGEAYNLHQLAWLAHHDDEYEAARSYFEQSLAINRALGDEGSAGEDFHGLGCVMQSLGDVGAARAYYEQGLVASRGAGDRNGEAINVQQLGWLASHRGDFGAARSCFEQALKVCREHGDRHAEAANLHGLGLLSHRRGDSDGARELLDQSRAIKRELGDQNGEAWSLCDLAHVMEAQGDLEAARSCLTRAVEIARKIGRPNDEARYLHHLGMVVREQGDLAQARVLLTESLTLERQLGAAWLILVTVEEWAALALAEEDAGRAARLAGAAQAGREAASTALPPEQRDTHERTLAGARAALGEEAFTAAWDAGRAMSLDEAVAYALGEG